MNIIKNLVLYVKIPINQTREQKSSRFNCKQNFNQFQTDRIFRHKFENVRNKEKHLQELQGRQIDDERDFH